MSAADCCRLHWRRCLNAFRHVRISQKHRHQMLQELLDSCLGTSFVFNSIASMAIFVVALVRHTSSGSSRAPRTRGPPSTFSSFSLLFVLLHADPRLKELARHPGLTRKTRTSAKQKLVPKSVATQGSALTPPRQHTRVNLPPTSSSLVKLRETLPSPMQLTPVC